jgi:hypothetical protein
MNKLMSQGYNEYRLTSLFHKFYGWYKDLVCDYKLSLAHMRNYLFHTLCETVTSILVMRRVISYTWFRLRAHGGFDRSADDAYSSAAPVPTLAFVDGLYCPALDFVFVFGLWLRFTHCELQYFVETIHISTQTRHSSIDCLLFYIHKKHIFFRNCYRIIETPKQENKGSVR